MKRNSLMENADYSRRNAELDQKLAEAQRLERRVEFLPAWDRRDPDPRKNYGIHGVEMRWYVKGRRGVVQFVVYTNWMLPHVWAEQEGRANYPRSLDRPMAAGIGYHSPSPTYEGQSPTRGECPLLDGRACYYDGSVLQADELFQTLIAQGGEAVWDELELRYREQFEQAPSEETA